MAYNTKAIKTDINAKPIPQLYNSVTDEYEVLQGVGGAARQVLYGPDGQPISTTGGKLAVRAAELETKIEAVRVLLNTLAGEDFATQTTLAQILAKMIAAPATEAKQDSLATMVGAIEDKLDEGQLAVRAAELETAISNLQTALGSQSTAVKQDALVALVGALDAAAVSDPAAAGAVIALLKGLLSRLQTLENKIDSFTTGEETVNTELKGSLVAYDSEHGAFKTVNASLLHESFDFKNTKEVTVSPGSYLVDTFRPTNGYAMLRIITKRIGAAHNWRLCANWSSDGTQVYQVVEKLHTATSGDADTQTVKIVTPVGSQWVMLQLFNDDTVSSHDYHVHMMLTAA